MKPEDATTRHPVERIVSCGPTWSDEVNYTWRERFARWLCEKFGHKARIEYDNPGGGDPEICRRCNRLLSTAYSRERAANTQ